MKRTLMVLGGGLALSLFASELETKPAPEVDRVGFPGDYPARYRILRTVVRNKEAKIVTVYENEQAASVTNAVQLPYPYGSVIVMETSDTAKDSEGKPVLDGKGELKRDKVTGLHVMRREKGFGEAYGTNRTGEWEYVEYRPDGTYITPPAKSFACAECHVKAGVGRDFVYKGRLAGPVEKQGPGTATEAKGVR